jgi:alanine racemase
MLYGASPFAEQRRSLGLQPVMTLESEIIGVQELAAGERVGYGGTFTAERPMRIGIVACGYADGYPRHAPTGTPIAVDGADADPRPGVDGHAGLRPDRHSRSRHRRAGHPVGRGIAGEVPADEVARRPAPSPTSCSAPWRHACRCSLTECYGRP